MQLISLLPPIRAVRSQGLPTTRTLTWTMPWRVQRHRSSKTCLGHLALMDWWPRWTWTFWNFRSLAFWQSMPAARMMEPSASAKCLWVAGHKTIIRWSALLALLEQLGLANWNLVLGSKALLILYGTMEQLHTDRSILKSRHCSLCSWKWPDYPKLSKQTYHNDS